MRLNSLMRSFSRDDISRYAEARNKEVGIAEKSRFFAVYVLTKLGATWYITSGLSAITTWTADWMTLTADWMTLATDYYWMTVTIQPISFIAGSSDNPLENFPNIVCNKLSTYMDSGNCITSGRWTIQ